MAEDDSRVPAGWYPDPLGLPQLRWWDNHAWTEHVSDARQPMVAQETLQPRLAFADDDEPATGSLPFADDEVDEETHELSRRERRERERHDDEPETDGDDSAPVGAPSFADPRLVLEAPEPTQLSTEEPSPAVRMAATGLLEDAPTSAPYDLDTRFDDLLGEPTLPRSAFAHASSGATRLVPDPTAEAASTRRAVAAEVPTGTGPVWVLTLIPLWSLVVGLLLLLATAHSDQSIVAGAFMFGIPYIAGIVLAAVDYRMLRRAGMDRPAHWAWAFLGALVYLVVRLTRTVRESGTGFGPLLTFVVLGIFLIGAIIAVPGLVMQLSPTTFSAEAQKVVAADASIIGARLNVDCPAVPPLIVQGTFTCQATKVGDSSPFDVTVSLQRSNGWIDWRVDDWGVFSATS